MLVLICLNFSAMVLFCLAMSKHRRQVLTYQISSIVVRFFRPVAWLLLLFTANLSVELFGWSIGPVLFIGSLSVSILLLILLITYQVRRVPQFAIVLSLMVGISILTG
jgi:hypothetical protein